MSTNYGDIPAWAAAATLWLTAHPDKTVKDWKKMKAQQISREYEQRVRNQKTDAIWNKIIALDAKSKKRWKLAAEQVTARNPLVSKDVKAMLEASERYCQELDEIGATTVSDCAKGVPIPDDCPGVMEREDIIAAQKTITDMCNAASRKLWQGKEYESIIFDELKPSGTETSLEDWLGGQLAQWRKNRGPSMQERWEEQWDQLTCSEMMAFHDPFPNGVAFSEVGDPTKWPGCPQHTPFMNVKELNDSWHSRIIRAGMRPGLISHGGFPDKSYLAKMDLQAAQMASTIPGAMIHIPDGYEFLNGKVVKKQTGGWFMKLVKNVFIGMCVGMCIAPLVLSVRYGMGLLDPLNDLFMCIGWGVSFWLIYVAIRAVRLVFESLVKLNKNINRIDGDIDRMRKRMSEASRSTGLTRHDVIDLKASRDRHTTEILHAQKDIATLNIRTNPHVTIDAADVSSRLETGEGRVNMREAINAILEHIGMDFQYKPAKAVPATLKLVPVKKATPAKKKK